MTHLCYTLEEAAEKLKLSETVLVRLSQYFKVPRTAYEDVGYLSFKGDLAFTEQDLEFFRQAKERLLSGQSLDEVKSRMREEPVISAGANQWTEIPAGAVKAPPASASAYGAYRMPAAQPSPLRQSPVQPAKDPPAWDSIQPSPTYHEGYTAPPEALPLPESSEQDASGGLAGDVIREIQDRKPYEKAAEQSFERYKSIHRAGLGKVFENMLKEVGSSGARKRPASAGYSPVRNKSGQATEAVSRTNSNKPDAFLPFMRGLGNLAMSKSTNKADVGWEQVIHQAISQPRTLNTQLKSAAALLRQRAMEANPRQEQRRP